MQTEIKQCQVAGDDRSVVQLFPLRHQGGDQELPVSQGDLAFELLASDLAEEHAEVQPGELL
eukprot:1975715-Prorocentrum_lima.AAC.1